MTIEVDAEDTTIPDDTAGDRTDGPDTAVRFRRSLAESIPVGALATVVAWIVYGSWNHRWSEPMHGGGDESLIDMMVKAVQTGGWYLHNGNLNAPFGQQFYDFPHPGETLQMVVVRLLATVTDNPFQLVNIYYALGFPLLAMVTFLVLRRLRIGAIAAGAVALLYTFLPYHFAHSQKHLFRSTYLTAPIAALLLFQILSWRSEFLVDPEAPMGSRSKLRANLAWRRIAVAFALCIVVATWETMTLAFFLTLLAVGGLLVAIRRRDPATMVAVAAAVVVCAGAFLVVLSPNLNYWRAHGSNDTAARRYPAEQELYGLKPAQMLLPVPNHRIQQLHGWQKDVRDRRPVASEEGQGLGFIGAAGLLTILGWALMRGIDGDRGGPMTRRDRLLSTSGLSAWLAIVLAVASGFAIVMSLIGFSQIRVWNRVVTLIGFFALLPVAMLFDRMVHRPHPGRRRVAAIAAVAVLTGLGVFDTAGVVHPVRGESHFTEVRSFVTDVEGLLPRSASVFQLPVAIFPESPAMGSASLYDQLLPYLWASPAADLRWSAGGVKGRPNADWQLRIETMPMEQVLPGLVGLGFDAVEVDLLAYPDGEADRVLDELQTLLGEADVSSLTGRWRLWDLGGYAAEHGLTTADLRDAAGALVDAQIAQLPTVRGVGADANVAPGAD